MKILRFSAPVLMGTLFLVSGCKKTDKAPAAEPAGSAAAAGSAAPATPPPAAQTPPAPPAAGNTSVVPANTLEAINLPPPKGAPAKGIWSAAAASDDGDRSTNFVDGSDVWVGVRFLDCNLPAAKDAANKPEADRGDFKYCLGTPTGKIKDYALFAPHDTRRVVKVGHLIVIADLGVTGETKLKAADLEAFLGSMDLAAIAKL
jgi:hypothetical protein